MNYVNNIHTQSSWSTWNFYTGKCGTKTHPSAKRMKKSIFRKLAKDHQETRRRLRLLLCIEEGKIRGFLWFHILSQNGIEFLKYSSSSWKWNYTVTRDFVICPNSSIGTQGRLFTEWKCWWRKRCSRWVFNQILLGVKRMKKDGK
jgi:hypothetical protein